MSAATTGRATRRDRGTPRSLLLDAARHLFSERGYRATSTREIADRATVSENLLFRYFDSKAGLFREAVVLPFVDVVGAFEERWQQGFAVGADSAQVAHQFIGELYDLFRGNRALVTMLWAGRSANDDLQVTGLADQVNDALHVLVRISETEAARRGESRMEDRYIATRSTVAMIAGMAVFSSSFYGSRRPAREAIVTELTRATLHGHHRRP